MQIKADRQVFINLNMHITEAEKLLMLMAEIKDDQRLESWVKKYASQLHEVLKGQGVK